MTFRSPRVKFVTLWCLLAAAKLWLAANLDLFGDEAFYAWEARHPAWAYSDLPAGTAWLAWLGMTVGGQTPLGLRWPFLLMGAAMPWLIVHLGTRWGGGERSWQAGLLFLLMPLTGLLGVLALPDVPLTFASLLCLVAIAELLERRRWSWLVVLAVGLVLGGLSHYRFVVPLAAGFAGLLLSGGGRRLLGWYPLWLALAVGAGAWLPLLLWNLDHHSAGLAFQLVERHPWQFQWQGLVYPFVQAFAVTPLLFALLLWTLWRVFLRWRKDGGARPALVLGTAALPLLGYFVLGFFADSERTSFHWPLPAYLPLMAILPSLFVETGATRWRRWLRPAQGLAAIGLLVAFAWLAAAAVPSARQHLADARTYPDNFAGWRELAAGVRMELAAMPADTALVVDNFMPAAALAFHLDRPGIDVLDHPLNRKHGRAVQLALWERLVADLRQRQRPVLLVMEEGAVRMRERLDWYQRLCEMIGPLPASRVVEVDHGRKRFHLFRLGPRESDERAGCVAPALGYIDVPESGERVSARFTASGWVLKEGIGVRRVDVVVDGEIVARAQYGLPRPDVSSYWQDSSDPGQPDIGFQAELDLGALPPGEHRIALRIEAGDGSVETLASQPFRLAR